MHNPSPYLLLLDVDGVLCKNKTYNKEGHVVSKEFNDHDWTFIKIFKSLNIPVVFISGDEFNRKIAESRNIEFLLAKDEKGLIDKASFIEGLKYRYGLPIDRFIFCGDDIFDLNLLKAVGYAFCPADANPLIKGYAANLVAKAGEGIVGEIYFRMGFPSINRIDMEKILEIDAKEHI